LTDRNALSPNRPARRVTARGFSLIEVLISMLLALITFLIMFQMFESWDRNKRSTASGGGAMVTGALAMFRLERDLRLAGFGFGNAAELGCTVSGYYSTRPTAAASGAISATDSNHLYTFPLTPFQIIDGASGAPDQLVVLYGSSEGVSTTRFFGTGAAGAQSYALSTSSSVQMDIGGRGGIQLGDLVVVAQNGTDCNLVEVTDNTNSDRVTFNFSNSGTYEHYYTKATTLAPLQQRGRHDRCGAAQRPAAQRLRAGANAAAPRMADPRRPHAVLRQRLLDRQREQHLGRRRGPTA
jgi:Tfp pilus assembly protein PilW